ncbi:hypothetical protein BDQ17DRAFT_1328921 [Cyathus striatus]|nr:hypothetical protein BDQ17DRAFT_1328921 [Cyathus striatus]
MVASGHVPNMPPGALGVNKRYRPAPAKTFQCRGYGECRMVFSRSEHLARHIRKHTGERPFTYSHADKQDQNERMMRELTTLHATMAAANKATGRGRRQPPSSSSSMTMVKQEERYDDMYPRHQQQQWEQQQQQQQQSSAQRPSNHSFRPSPPLAQPTQSFLAPQQPPAGSNQSFRLPSPNATFAFSSGSAPSSNLSNGTGTPNDRLPPLAAVVPAPGTLAGGLSFPRRPGTSSGSGPSAGSRPGTAPGPAGYFILPSGRPGSSGLGGLFSSSSTSSQSSSSQQQQPSQQQQQYDDPFFFHPPDLTSSSTTGLFQYRRRPETAGGGAGGYEYGSDSRPASRRLSVMELCNEEGRPGTAGGVSGANINFAAISANASSHPSAGYQLNANGEYEYQQGTGAGTGFYPTSNSAFLLRGRAGAEAGQGEKRDRRQVVGLQLELGRSLYMTDHHPPRHLIRPHRPSPVQVYMPNSNSGSPVYDSQGRVMEDQFKDQYMEEVRYMSTSTASTPTPSSSSTSSTNSTAAQRLSKEQYATQLYLHHRALASFRPPPPPRHHYPPPPQHQQIYQHQPQSAPPMGPPSMRAQRDAGLRLLQAQARAQAAQQEDQLILGQRPSTGGGNGGSPQSQQSPFLHPAHAHHGHGHGQYQQPQSPYPGSPYPQSPFLQQQQQQSPYQQPASPYPAGFRGYAQQLPAGGGNGSASPGYAGNAGNGGGEYGDVHGHGGVAYAMRV